MKLTTLVIISASLLIWTNAFAAEDDEGKKKRRGPPAVALEACSALVAGDPCSFENRRGNTLDGECAERRTEELVCRPNDHEERRLRRKERREAADNEEE